jgi:lipid-A-disaccharide synthase-like uncharacterized protein
MFVMSQKILEANKHGGFIGFIVYGSQRIGKSSYGLQVLKEIYGDWDLALKHTLFDLREVVQFLQESVDKGYRIPAIMWDDCGVHGNKMLYFSNRSLVQYLSSLIDVVGINLGGLIATTPSPANLLRVLRGYEFYRVKIFVRDNSGGRRAIGYLSSLLPSGSRLIHRKFSDFYNVYLPDEIWRKYSEKRKTYLSVALANLKSFLEKPAE